MNRQKANWQTRFGAQVRKATGDFVAWLAGGDLWLACGCGAHWLTPECGVDCVLTHRQYKDWNLCNWPPEMLKYWDWRNWREWTPPVDYPHLPTAWPLSGDDFRYAVVLTHIDPEAKIVYYNTEVSKS